MSEKLGELLVRDGIISREQLVQALQLQREKGGSLGENLVAINAIQSVDDIASQLAQQLNTQVVNLDEVNIPSDILALVPEEMALKFHVVPVGREDRLIHVVIADPRNISALDAIRFLTGCTVKVWVAPFSQVRRALDRYYLSNVNTGEFKNILQDVEELNIEVVQSGGGGDEADKEDFLSQVSEAPLVRLVNKLLADAVKLRASDIHIESYEKIMRVRYRIDGTLIEQTPLPYKLRNAIVSRLKIMSNLDISERRLPQDGRIKMAVGRKVIDLRVNTLPTVFGEKVVLRILDADNLNLNLAKIGFSPKALKDVERAIDSPFGMILVTGPTGSGKSTTLYSALSTVNKGDVNIMTAEDPVEYNLEGINQVLVNSEIGLTFASALRAFLRQDPDIIMVGEIRDLETAQIAVKAALTGHLVFSTLHTNDAPSTISRLWDMGIEPFLIASSIKLITAQRLLRKICTNCKIEDDSVGEELHTLVGLSAEEAKGLKFFTGKGCPDCAGTGFKGRVAIHQVLPVTPTIKNLILDRASPDEIEKASVAEGSLTLRMSALEYLKQGHTGIREVIRSTEG